MSQAVCLGLLAVQVKAAMSSGARCTVADCLFLDTVAAAGGPALGVAILRARSALRAAGALLDVEGWGAGLKLGPGTLAAIRPVSGRRGLDRRAEVLLAP